MGGAISAVPYHTTVKFFERLSLCLYLLGVFVFTSPFEKNNHQKGLYGSCIAATRADYEKISGHSSVRAELLDDLNLGERFIAAGVGVHNYIGCGFVSFRMYRSLSGEINGFGKGAVLSTAKLKPATLFFTVLWILGLLVCQFGLIVLLFTPNGYTPSFAAGYALYTLQIGYFLRYTGKYGWVVPVLHPIGSVFFLLVVLYSAYRVTFVGSVVWKGREIRVSKKVK